ncbi:sugar kinase (plasmid) [Deinococcus metallilatus]|uniref:Sugar kinase n=1 Tax=Deinococcus metallilatus TaxID=1211322 RepID=A0AAJ5K1T1_9DEIO|nr:FGGY-family carbohydrate kinase [Deinococcus metallilatus]MBB5297361.1 xylulokinase [Deinococcus metallilatus]QBY06928.1 sugar kinase [Deinococcus metallilatus]TLK32318.1 sugar kinase [Deinococcus metallilatus]GMA17066.1 sugar kinase [Deinococcus metallilatus]
MSAELLVGIDVGTYSSKGVLVSLDGQILRQHVIPHGISLPAPGHVEQDAEEVWWADTVALLRELLSGPYSGADVAGIALSAIGPTLLPLDREGRPLRPGILYGVDTRGGAQIDALQAEIGEEAIFAHSGMALTSQAIGPKMRWLREREPEVWARTRTLTTASSYLTFRLTGRHVMDHHTAAHSMPLYDPRARTWSAGFAPPVLGDRGLELLPDLAWSEELAGYVTAEAAAQTGLREGTPVAVGTVDALSEAVSVGAVNPGDLMIMYGSTTFFVLVQEAPTPDPRVWTVGGAFAGQHNLAAGMSTTGSLTRWFVDELAREHPTGEAYNVLFTEAAGIAPGADGLLLLPYFSGERTPINDPRARGVIAGLTLAHTRAHLFRAVLEGVGYGIRQNIEAFRDLGADVRRIVAVGGGARTRTWLQIVSDISGEAQVLPGRTVGASYGDAFLAGRAAGFLGPEDLNRWVKIADTIQPNAAPKADYDRLYGLYRDLYVQTRPTVHALSRSAG